MEEELLEPFDNGAVDKGRAYFARGAVRELIVNDEVITALVKGSRPDPYVVTVPMDPESGLPEALDGDCTCPMGSLCKHTAATLISYARRGERSLRLRDGAARSDASMPMRLPAANQARLERQAALRQLEQALDRPKSTRESVIPISGPAAAPYSHWVNDFLRPPPAPAASGEQWRLVFAVGRGIAPAPPTGEEAITRWLAPCSTRLRST